MAAAFVVAYKTSSVITGNKVYLSLRIGKNFLLCGRYYSVYNRNGYSALCRILEACGLYFIKNYCGNACSVNGNAAVDNFTELFFTDLILNYIVIALDKVCFGVLYGICPFKVECMSRIGSVNKSQILRERLVEYNEAYRTPNKTALALFIGHTNPDRSVKSDDTVGISHYCLVLIPEYLVGALFFGLNKGKVI